MAQQSVFKTFLLAANFKPLFNTRLPVLYQSTVGLKQNTKDLLQKLNIPERPKKPLSPYFKFMVDNRDALQKSNPGITMSQISKKVAEAWKSLDSSKKLSYQQQYRQELEDYTKKFLQYESTLNEQQREALQIAKVEKTEDRKKRKIKKLYKETEKPKRPLTSYLIFAIEESKKLQKTPIEASPILKDKWANLSAEEKERYKILAQQNKVKYEEEMAIWEKKMQEEGKEFLVRKTGKRSDAVPSRLVRKSKST